MTGDELFFFLLLCFDDFFARAGRGDHAPWLPDAGLLPEGASPGDFVDSVFGFLGPCGVLLPLGGLGPLAVFSRCFPQGSWVGGGAFFSLLPLASCVFLS